MRLMFSCDIKYAVFCDVKDMVWLLNYAILSKRVRHFQKVF